MNNLSSMGMLNDVNSNDGAPFDRNDFPQLTSRPNSAGGPQGQLGKRSLAIAGIKDGVGLENLGPPTYDMYTKP
ncbi:hypothetical protein RHGRI_017255 [Rhododendron griersonianum]|uniref:Uncharacterized protein n=1 Tax=Rhododendron griersonianum TaxID=479676 RepID=A0AAV6JX48_9ERIC|nr:hypothetical protein RHGRI_017255 [Rhododendron griersonianum]